MAEPLLQIEGLTCGYGDAIVLSDVDLRLEAGRSLALLGRNGTGKTTLIDTLVGATKRHAGRITLAGTALHELPSYARAAVGIGWVPQERNIFKSLTVDENLTAVARPGPWTRSGSTSCFRAWRSASATSATSSPAASSRCWPSHVRWC
jgi:branched-chain amino acid transport system ATP-binding protein